MEDPVEHLRAAALSTLKSKRRKPVPVKPSVAIQSQKPPPAESLQLDYGLDENVGGDVTTPLKNEPPSLSQSKLPTLDDEGHSREEGEISEGEDISMTVPSILPIHQLPAPTKSEKSENLEPQDEERSATSEAPLTTSPEAVPSVIKLPTPTPTLMERISEPVYTDVKQEERGDSMVFADRVSDDVDMQHVRPGLALTQEEYDSVKVIVLDLLGWGVDFKYLFESGINKSLLYYVFNELNLRLPNDFDMTGIVLYTPEAITEAQQASASMTSPPAPNTSSLSPEIVRLPKPSLSSRLTTPPPTSVLTQAMGSPVDSDLHDMERRRRQELVARKAAAQASRKTKRSDHGKMFVITTSDGAQENDTNSLIPAETVDDFLNSLGPVQNLKLSITDNTHPLPEMKDDMEVDSTPEQKQLIESDPEKAIQRHASSDRSFSEPPPLSSEAPPTSVSSTSTTFSPVTSAFVLDTEAPPPARIQPVRRGTKRPVASDFVDFDSSPRKHNSFRHTEHINGNGQLNAIPRRVPTSTSFHNIGASRRCVIELSDSEEEGGPQSSAQQLYEESARQRKELNRQGKQILYPSPAPFKASDAMSPAALAQKESEIRKMRELIAQREEETRLRKLAMAKLQSNPGTRPSSTISNTGISLKQEDLDVVIAVAERLANNGQFTKNIRDPESATPPAEAASRASSSDFSTGFSTEIYPTGIEGARALPAQQQISQIADSTQGQDSPAARTFSLCTTPQLSHLLF
ncbi:hypothetical protein HYPSUDRAFT_46393 [Hypholoma sublateritium FD-334 SS-4]|uniref:Uncharacterized protein n=1 Tax=Hypholoma sublateritium (strain FD-334 SS-4) TaxID=945553 RepID=A0A0D2M2N8_HYPSF|nr:hypothetical protein HYPSUDRAFT_46393 [Hypholoma sublateritium FD-334 SS-4]